VITLPNVGVCDQTYLHHIYTHYDNLPDVTVFIPASGYLGYKKKRIDFTLDKTFETGDSVVTGYYRPNGVRDTIYDFVIDKHVTAEKNNRNNVNYHQAPANIRPFGAWYEHHFPGINSPYESSVGVFAASRKHIHQRPKDFYKMLLDQVSESKYHEASHFIERSWPAIFHPFPPTCFHDALMFYENLQRGGSRMAPPKGWEQFLTPDGALVWTLTSNGYKFYTLNLVRHLQRAGVPWKLCIVCADKASAAYFRGEGIPTVSIDNAANSDSPNMSPFGSAQFKMFNKLKLALLCSFQAESKIRTCVYMDGDITVYKDFLPDLTQRVHDPNGPGLMFQCDEQERGACKAEDGSTGGKCGNACSGFIGWRAGAAPASIFCVPGNENIWNEQQEDQVFIKKMIERENIPYETFPRDLYPNGALASNYKVGNSNRDKAYILHYNYLVGNAKRAKMNANGDWIIPY
jgi:hypothetical protein